MRKLLAAVAVLLSSCVGSAQDKVPVQITVQAAPEQIKKVAMEMFALKGYSLDSDTALQLKISKPFSDEETAAYNTAHWTNQPVPNCRHVQSFLLSPDEERTRVTMTTEMVCHANQWVTRREGDQKEIQWEQCILADLKTKIEETNKQR